MDLSGICRTCLQRGRPVQSLFDENDELFSGGAPLVEFVNMFTEIMVLRIDGFPEQICTACLNDIKRAYAFKLRCECSENTLYRLKETNTILDLDKFNFEMPYLESQQQVNENSVNSHWYDDGTNIGRFREITESVINLLQIDYSDTKVIENDNLQTDLNALLQHETYVEKQLAELTVETVNEAECEGENLLKCSACPSTFPDQIRLKTHVVDYHTDGRFCLICQKDFESIKSHADQHLFPRLQCPHCTEKFEYRPLLNAHLRTHMVKVDGGDQLAFQCDQCSRTFINHHEYLSHKRMHSDDRPFRCETCGMAFKRRDKLKAHMTSHSDERPFKCALCDSRFKRKDNLTSHLKSVHQQGGKMYKCTICDKAFRFKDKLRAHTNTHLRLFSCETCHAGFPRKETLDRHIEQKHRIPDGTAETPVPNVSSELPAIKIELKSFPCSVCSREFNFPESLANHMRTHVKKTELKCELCSKVFTQTNKLKSHMITHTDLRPFQCSVCPSEFKRKDNLNRHMKKHRFKVGARNSYSVDSKLIGNWENDENCDKHMSDSNNKVGESVAASLVEELCVSRDDQSENVNNRDDKEHSQRKLSEESHSTYNVGDRIDDINESENGQNSDTSFEQNDIDSNHGHINVSSMTRSHTITNLLNIAEPVTVSPDSSRDREPPPNKMFTRLRSHTQNFSNSITIAKQSFDNPPGVDNQHHTRSLTPFSDDATENRVQNKYDCDSTTVAIQNET